MKRKTWVKNHKWIGIIITFFLVMFCLSGIVLNHRQLFSDINVSRGILPGQYEFNQWNNGLLRGTLRYKDNKNKDKVFIYGAAGVIQTDTTASHFTEYNKVYLLVLTIDRCEEWLKPHKMTCLRLASWTYIN